MITSVRLQDFKGHRDTQVPLGRFSVLVGPNGSGKTSVLEALWLQSQFARRQVRQVLTGDWSADDLLRRGAEGPIVLTSVGTQSGQDWSARTEIKPGSVTLVWKSGAGERTTDFTSNVFFDFRGASGVPAHAASEGTLITLALLTVLHGPNRPNILLLDDFDQSLHPQAQIELVRLIKRLLDQLPDVQIVATTHSPYVLDELDPFDVHAFALRDDGTVAVKRLSEHPEADKMKGALSAGQLWSLDPEKNWVLERAS